MAESPPKRRLPLVAIVVACLCLACLWVASFFATGLLWWRASDLYETPVPRPEAVVPPASLEEAFAQQEATTKAPPGS